MHACMHARNVCNVCMRMYVCNARVYVMHVCMRASHVWWSVCVGVCYVGMFVFCVCVNACVYVCDVL